MDLSPKQIVEQLDKYIIGQDEAKKAVAIALRNRYRRSRLPKEVREEITPKNIIMKGPTGVGKTEIARRLHTVMEYLLEDVSFNAGGMDVPAPIPVAITGAYVDEHLSKLTGNRDLKKYVL